ncbi:signal peptidase II [Puniceicoccaceae bacterium K14]|nr:signal peptidase II [Puniceicoccaceae bacterium K14]
MKFISDRKTLLVLMLAVFFLDQLTKLWVEKTIPFGSFFNEEVIVVIPDFFRIVHVGNTGAAWSMFSGQGHILGLLGITALVSVFVFHKYLELYRPINQFAFGLATGGILGNITDRFRLGHVIDFLDFKFFNYHYPSFNVADSGICVGVLLYAIVSFRTESKKSSKTG